jgi:hypothetical protein
MRLRLVQSYDELAPYLDRPFNHPQFDASFTRDEFQREYDSTYDSIAEALQPLGGVAHGGLGRGRFSMSRYVDLTRAITIVAREPSVFSPAVLYAIHGVLTALPVEYAVCIDSYPAYACILRDGTVLGYTHDTSDPSLHAFGFATNVANPYALQANPA